MRVSSYNYTEKSNSQEYIEKLCKEYIVNQVREQERDELIHENNIEKRDIKGYHGREILELLQNADDAYQKSINEGNAQDCELEVFIEFKENKLTISNTGTFFDEEGIKAIVQGNNSSKSGNYIGNKGTGFRSVLNWADEINIYSGDFNVKFSKEFANTKFQEIKSKNQIKKQLLKNPDLYIPMLSVPQNIEPKQNHDMTSIEILINKDKIKDNFGVLKQIKNIDLRILLFLPNIKRIKIETEDEEIIYERGNIKGEFDGFSLKKYSNGAKQIDEQFYIFNKVIEKKFEEDGQIKDIRLSIAIPKNLEDFEVGNVYSFFPLLDVKSPFNCIMHATYILGDHRDTINRNKVNKTIITEQLKFLIVVAEKFASKKYADTALRLLTPVDFKNKNWKFPPVFSQFSVLEEFYLEKLERAKILQTVNDDYISMKDIPIMFNCDFPQLFIGENFKTLLKPVNRESAILIQYLASRLNQSLNIEENNLLLIINRLTKDWQIYEQIEVFSWWNRNYSKTLPQLLKTQNESWLKFGDECYFLVGNFSSKGLPSWVSVPSLASEYQKLLFKDAEQLPKIQKIKETNKEIHISRLISQNNIYPSVRFTYRDRSNIISTVNSSVNNYNKSIDFVKWLWSNYQEEGEDWTPPKGSEQSPIKYNFPNAKEKIFQDSKKLYFGYAYGYELSRKLFDNTYEEMPSPNHFFISKEKTKNFSNFISKFGVKRFPIIEKQEVIPLDSYAMKYDKIIKSNEDIGSSSKLSIRYKLPFITNLENKLKELTTIDIVRWIHEDSSLKSYLNNPFYSENAEIIYRGNLQQYDRPYKGQIQNYLLIIFNAVKWVEIGGKKYSPREIIKNTNSRDNSKFSNLLPILDSKLIQDIAYSLRIDYNEVLKIMELFDFCDKVTDLGSDDFYSLMLKLSEYDFQKSIDLSKSVYRIIEQANFTKKYEDSESKNKFFDIGKVLVQYRGKLQYYSARESYLPSTKIISKPNVPIVKKGQRTNNDNFIRTFGCQQYNKEYSIKKETISESKSNPNFQHYFSEFKKYAGAYSERNENFERTIRMLSIILVDKISIIENNEVIKITDEYICIRKSAISWYITVFENDYEINQISEAIENICANIANTVGFESGKLGELFRAREKSDREFLIKKEFGSLDVISDDSYKNEVKNNFIKTIQKINKNYPINEIDLDFENFSSDQNCEKLIKILLSIETDVERFKQTGFVYKIDLITYYKKNLTKFINHEKRRFKTCLYNKAIMDESLQSIFLSTVMEFENFEIDKYENSIYFDVKSIVRKLFANWDNNELEDNELLDPDVEYSKKYEFLNPDRLFEDEIANNTNVQRMIYFNKEIEFKTWLATKKDSQLSNTNEPIDLYSKYEGVIPQKEEITFSDPSIKKSSKKHRSNGSYNKKSAERRSKNQKIFGNKGELIVYNLLCKDFGKENVYPKSEAFVEMGILKPGQDSSGQYDLSYIDKSGTEFFVEVKTGNGKSFIISPGELDFAKQDPDHFKLFLVYEIDSDTPKYILLPKKFWEDKKYRKTEIVERIEFEF